MDFLSQLATPLLLNSDRTQRGLTIISRQSKVPPYRFQVPPAAVYFAQFVELV